MMGVLVEKVFFPGFFSMLFPLTIITSFHHENRDFGGVYIGFDGEKLFFSSKKTI